MALWPGKIFELANMARLIKKLDIPDLNPVTVSLHEKFTGRFFVIYCLFAEGNSILIINC